MLNENQHPINDCDGCAFAVTTTLPLRAYITNLTCGGGYFPSTGVIEIVDMPRLHSATSRRTEHHSIRTIGKWSNSQNGYVLNPLGTSHCIAGGGNGHDTTMPRVILTEDE